MKRDGIELTGVRGDHQRELRVGALEETITVTGETPIVDVQSVRRQTIGRQRRDQTSIPTARSWAAIMVLIPAIRSTQAGAASTSRSRPDDRLRRRRRRNNEGRMQVDGLDTGAAFNGGGVSTYVADIAQRPGGRDHHVGRPGRGRSRRPDDQHRAEDRRQHLCGPALHRRHGSAWSAATTTTSCARGPPRPASFKLWDFNVGVGGPIKQDRSGSSFSSATKAATDSIPGIFANANVGDPTKWTYEPDTERRRGRRELADRRARD